MTDFAERAERPDEYDDDGNEYVPKERYLRDTQTGTCTCGKEWRAHTVQGKPKGPDCRPRTWEEEASLANDAAIKRRNEGREYKRQRDILEGALQRLCESVGEVAIHSLRYCEEKFDHDDQARLNMEAALSEAQADLESVLGSAP